MVTKAAFIVAAGMVLGCAASAHAKGADFSQTAVTALGGFILPGAGGATAAFTIDDVLNAARHKKTSRAEGIAEAITMTASFAVGLGVAVPVLNGYTHHDPFYDDRSSLGLGLCGVIEAVWSSALIIHGLSAIDQSAPKDTGGARTISSALRLTVMPSVINGPESAGGGLLLAAQF